MVLLGKVSFFERNGSEALRAYYFLALEREVRRSGGYKSTGEKVNSDSRLDVVRGNQVLPEETVTRLSGPAGEFSYTSFR